MGNFASDGGRWGTTKEFGNQCGKKKGRGKGGGRIKMSARR